MSELHRSRHPLLWTFRGSVRGLCPKQACLLVEYAFHQDCRFSTPPRLFDSVLTSSWVSSNFYFIIHAETIFLFILELWDRFVDLAAVNARRDAAYDLLLKTQADVERHVREIDTSLLYWFGQDPNQEYLRAFFGGDQQAVDLVKDRLSACYLHGYFGPEPDVQLTFYELYEALRLPQPSVPTIVPGSARRPEILSAFGAYRPRQPDSMFVEGSSRDGAVHSSDEEEQARARKKARHDEEEL